MLKQNMMSIATVILAATLVSQVYTAPQLISFKDGKLGVNFGGYHAAVGLGGLLGSGASGGLFAEAGTPFGQSAGAGLGGTVDSNGGSRGGLYAGATAGRNIQAAAGLAGGVNEGTSAGSGYASAQAGNQFATSRLAGKTSSGFAVIEESDNNKLHAEIDKQILQNEVKTEVLNEVKPLSENKFDFETNKEIQTPLKIEKEVSYKPHSHHIHKSAYVGSFVDSTSGIGLNSPQLIQKQIDVGSENHGQGEINSGGQVSYKKEVNIGRNPHFFDDIFNIPISALTAVKTFLTNTAENTNLSIQKSGSVQSETDSITPKHLSSSSITSSDAHISVKTPSASQLLDDIIAIPINTLGAVNTFLNNNVPIRKRVTQEGEEDSSHKRLGPIARRRAFKKIVTQENNDNAESKNEESN
ncbi:unnamed protein product [Parnassius apollo]|uniref:(apollo) hypothetical protein n=1 Tax=Parnassius apollo TaxID=110799 RepID=A0A8S3XN18_PARAO|nr:unnamed protein product [Parnassius apollo]